MPPRLVDRNIPWSRSEALSPPATGRGKQVRPNAVRAAENGVTRRQKNGPETGIFYSKKEMSHCYSEHP